MSRRRLWRRRDEVPVVELNRTNPVRFALVLILVVVVAVYFGFTKRIPFKHGYQLHAVFASTLNIHSKSPVRIAGVDVGKVASIKRDGSTGVVTMEIESRGLPIHSDATLKIRPRIFLEGNWFVELQPGSPSAKTLSSGATIPVTQTADPVQLDQVLDALNTDTRANLQKFLIYYGEGLTRKPEAAENAEQLPEVRGINAAEALNKTYHLSPPALRGGAIVNQAITGTEEHDFSKLIAGIGKVTSALNVHEQELGELISNFNTFFSAFALQSTALHATVAELPSTLGNIRRGLTALDGSFAPTREFAHAILPGVRSTDETVKAALPFIEQTKASLAPSELGGVAKGLDAATPSLAKLSAEQVPLFTQTEQFNKCLTNVIYPTGNAKLQDGNSSSGVENYKEFWYSLVGLAGIGQSFDGNGPFTKFLVGNSGTTLISQPAKILGETGPATAENLRLLGRAPLKPEGTRPAYPASEPPYEPLVPCSTQTLPEFNGPLSTGPGRRERRMTPPTKHEGGLSVRDQIERYRTAFISVVTMVVIAAAVGGYVLAHENLKLPSWVPVLGHNYFTLKAEFQTAQAVTPGQGQAVTIAGAKVGEVSTVDLHEGLAVVTMKVTPKYARFYRNATLLLRPKTQLQDITIEVNPGTPSAGKLKSGETIPLSQTAPDINFDEFLAGLDTETRAYLQELLAGAGEGLDHNGLALSATLKRFEPAARFGDEIQRELTARQANIGRSIHNFRLLMEELGTKDTEIAQLVDSSNAVFKVFAKEDANLQSTLHLLPSALHKTGHALNKVAIASDQVGPALHKLLPFANVLAPANEATRRLALKATPIIKNEIRPFAREILPTVNELGPSTQGLAESFPKLATSFSVINEFFNELAYNPGKGKAGFDFFLAWANHNLNSVVANADAHGTLGRSLIYFNCEVLPIIEAAGKVNETVKALLGLLRPPSEAECLSLGISKPKAASARAKAAKRQSVFSGLATTPLAALAARESGG